MMSWVCSNVRTKKPIRSHVRLCTFDVAGCTSRSAEGADTLVSWTYCDVKRQNNSSMIVSSDSWHLIWFKASSQRSWSPSCKEFSVICAYTWQVKTYFVCKPIHRFRRWLWRDTIYSLAVMACRRSKWDIARVQIEEHGFPSEDVVLMIRRKKNSCRGHTWHRLRLSQQWLCQLCHAQLRVWRIHSRCLKDSDLPSKVGRPGFDQ